MIDIHFYERLFTQRTLPNWSPPHLVVLYFDLPARSCNLVVGEYLKITAPIPKTSDFPCSGLMFFVPKLFSCHDTAASGTTTLWECFNRGAVGPLDQKLFRVESLASITPIWLWDLSAMKSPEFLRYEGSFRCNSQPPKKLVSTGVNWWSFLGCVNTKTKKTLA